MIDLSLLRENPIKIKEFIRRKELVFDVDKLIEVDEKARRLKLEVELIRKEKNELASKGAQGVTLKLRKKAINLGKKLKEEEEKLLEAEKKLKSLWLSCPNIPQEDVPLGNKESNKVVKTVGEIPTFSFPVKHHLELNEQLHWFDLEVAATMTGTQFVFYHEQGVKIIYALTNLMFRVNVKHGFKPVLPPTLIAEKGLYNSGNLPKFDGDFYSISDEDLCLIPTAEVSLTNIHEKEILSVEKLPIRYVAWTSCFRREAGGYGATERGLIRIHQFEKVELYSIVPQEDSNQELDRMISCAEEILQLLGLHYRVSLLAAQDCSFSSSKTYDIEVWLPGQNEYYEVSSASNCTDFQSRRAKIRYRTKVDAKPLLVHTLNASSLAIPRLMVALMETYQHEDGSIELPLALKKYMDNLW